MNCVVYESRGGTTKGMAKNVANKLGVDVYEVDEFKNEPFDKYEGFIFFTYTDKVGKVPEKSGKFLLEEEYSKRMVGVVSNGSTDFMRVKSFAKAGEIISEAFNVPLISKLDKGGTPKDEYNIINKSIKLFGYKEEKVAYKPELTKKVNGIFQMKRM